jgi:acyl-CoA synthetase (AMP-forming)/AMP-acid ligase II
VVVAFVKPRHGVQVDEAELRNFCAGHLANFKAPRRIYLVDTLPYHTAANGSKLQRHVLRDWARERAAAQPG